MSLDRTPRFCSASTNSPGTNRLRDAQAALDIAVRAAYGMSAGEDTLAFLLRLNLDLAVKESAGESITAPGLPAFIPHSGDFITPDCIRTVWPSAAT